MLYEVITMFAAGYSAGQPLAWIGDINIAVAPIDVSNPAAHVNDPCYHSAARDAFLEVCAFGFEDLFRKHHPGEESYSFFDYRVPSTSSVKKRLMLKSALRTTVRMRSY